MLADMIRGFCEASENKYEVYERYSGRMMFGRLTIGIIVKQDCNIFEMFAELTKYLSENEFDDELFELENTAIDDLGLDSIIYFPNIQNYP